MSESRSQEELAGDGPYPYVELTPAGPPLTITDAGPMPDPPPPPPFDRAAALAGLQAAFALLTDDELRVARRRMLGIPLFEIAIDLRLGDDEAAAFWKSARRKLGTALFGGG
jgi:hypothetical protein